MADPQSELVRSESDRHHATASVTPTVSNTVPGPAASPGPRLASSVDSSDVLVCPTEPDTVSVTALPRLLEADPASATAALAHPTAHQTPTHSSRIKHLRAPPSPNRSTQRTGLGPAPPPLPPTLATVPAPVAAVAPFAPSLPTVTETADPTTSIATNQTPTQTLNALPPITPIRTPEPPTVIRQPDPVAALQPTRHPVPCPATIYFHRYDTTTASRQTLTHVVEATDGSTTTMHGLRLPPRSLWTPAAVRQSLLRYVAISSAIDRALRAAISLHPHGHHATEPAIWSVTLPAAAADHLLAGRDDTVISADCRWVDSRSVCDAIPTLRAALAGAPTTQLPPSPKECRRNQRAAANRHRLRPRLPNRRPYAQPRSDRAAYCAVMRVISPAISHDLPFRPTVPAPPHQPPHLAAPPLVIHRWLERQQSPVARLATPTATVIAALGAERRLASAQAVDADCHPSAAPTPTVQLILAEASRCARSRGATHVTPLDVRHAAQLMATSASLKPKAPFIDPEPEHAAALQSRLAQLSATLHRQAHRRPRVLSFGDHSGIVANAFRAAGCDVISNDIEASEDPTLSHVEGDARSYWNAGFDFIIGAPPCTFLTNAGVVWLYREPERMYHMHQAAAFFRQALQADTPFLALENPAMHRFARASLDGLRATQYVHPHQHGHGETKSIGLWLHGLPSLQPEHLSPGRAHVRASLPQSPTRAAIRSRTYKGVAAAMALQWTPIINEWIAQQREGPRRSDDPRSAFDLCAAEAMRLPEPQLIADAPADANNRHPASIQPMPVPADAETTGPIADTSPPDLQPATHLWRCPHCLDHPLVAPSPPSMTPLIAPSAIGCAEPCCSTRLHALVAQAAQPRPSLSLAAVRDHAQRDRPLVHAHVDRLTARHRPAEYPALDDPGLDDATPAPPTPPTIPPHLQRPPATPSVAPSNSSTVPQHLQRPPLEPTVTPATSSAVPPHLLRVPPRPLHDAAEDQPAPPLVASAAPPPVRRPPSPTTMPPAATVTRLHLRRGVWWAWAPRHTPGDDHKYDWTRLDHELQQLLACRLSRLTVPAMVRELGETPPDAEWILPAAAPPSAAHEFATPPAHIADFLPAPEPLECAVAAVRPAPPQRPRTWKRKAQPPPCPTPPPSHPTVAAPLDTLCAQSLSLCESCEGIRTHTPRARQLFPHSQYGRTTRPACRRGVGAPACGCPAPPDIDTRTIVETPRANGRYQPTPAHPHPFIAFVRSTSAPIVTPAQYALTSLIAIQRMWRERSSLRARTARAIQLAYRCHLAATLNRRRVVPPPLTRLRRRNRTVAAAPPDSGDESTDYASDATGGDSDYETEFGDADIDDSTPSATLSHCAYLANVRIAQRVLHQRVRRYRLNSAACWVRSSLADTGAGPSIIAQRLLDAMPSDAVVRHRPRPPGIMPLNVSGAGGEALVTRGWAEIVFTIEKRPYKHLFQIVDGGDLLILGNDFLAQHSATVSPALDGSGCAGWVDMHHSSGPFRARLVQFPHRVAAAVRPPSDSSQTPLNPAVVIAALALAGLPPHVSDARQLARELRMPCGGSDLLTPSMVLGGEEPTTTSTDTALPSPRVDDTTAAGPAVRRVDPRDAMATLPASADGLAPADGEDDAAAGSTPPDDDDDGGNHPPEDAPAVAPPPNYVFEPWEELKTYSSLLYDANPISIPAKTLRTVRLKVPHRLANYDGPVEISRCPERHRLDHGLEIARVVAYIDPTDGTVPVQISNFTHRAHSIGSLIPICQIDYDTITTHDRRTSPSDSDWDRLPPKTRRALREAHVDESAVLTPAQRERVDNLLARRHRAFSVDSKVPGATHLLQVAVDLKPDATPFRHAPSRTGPVGEKIIDDAVADMEAHGIIRKSTSEWASRVVLVSKKSGEPRFCVDLRDLNSRLVVLDTPLPRTDDAIDHLGHAFDRPSDSIDDAPRAHAKLGGNLLFHTLDLTAGFWNLPVKESHRERLAFVTSKGKWEFNVLPFGLRTGPSYMQRMIEATLQGLSWEICLPYLDDVVVWANGPDLDAAFEQSLERLELVLERLEWAGLRAKPKKCHLFATSVEYLGHICSRDGVSLDPKKIAAVKTIKPSSINSLEAVRSFLGLAGYYRNHIHNFHVLSSPLVDLTRAGVDVPTESQKPPAQQSIRDLIDALTSDPVLMYPRSDRPFIVGTDAATGVGVGACLKQLDDDGTERVVAYHGRRFSKAERNYTVTECELLAVVEAVKHFRPYLWGRQFKLVTDHAALKWLHTMKETVSGGMSSRLTRWTLRLQEYNFDVEHKPGKDHLDADAVSRLVCDPDDTGATHSDPDIIAAILQTRAAVTAAVASALTSGTDPLAAQRDATAAVTAALFPSAPIAAARREPTGTPSDLTIVPPTGATAEAAAQLRDAVHASYLKSSLPGAEGIRAAQLADPACFRLLTAIASGTIADDQYATSTRRQLPRASVHDGLLHHAVDIADRPHRLLWIPESLRHDVTHAYHDQACHRGRDHTYQAMRRHVYWPGMFDYVADYVNRCHECSFAKRPNRHQGRSFAPEVGTYPFDCMVCDILDMSSHIGPTSRGSTKLVVFADSLSRWVEAVPISHDPTSEEILDIFIRHIFARYGFPRTIRSDAGSNLVSRLCGAIYAHSGIHLEVATAHHHNSVGLVERFNDTLCGMIRASDDQGKAWDEHLPFALFAYRSAPNRTTHESPAYLLYGRELRGPHHVGQLTGPLPSAAEHAGHPRRFIERLRLAWNLAYHQTRHLQGKDGNTADAAADYSPAYLPNDRVLLRVPQDTHTHKLANQWEGPYRIAPDGVLPNGNYRLIDMKDRRRRDVVSGDRLRLYLTVTDADRLAPDEFLVESLLNRRGTARDRQYLVKWRGYPKREATWEPRITLMVRCAEMVRAFDAEASAPAASPPSADATSPTIGTAPDPPPVAADSADFPPSTAPTDPPAAPPPASPASVVPARPTAAKFERGCWLYRLAFPARGGVIRHRWMPESRFSNAEIDQFSDLRAADSAVAAALPLCHDRPGAALPPSSGDLRAEDPVERGRSITQASALCNSASLPEPPNPLQRLAAAVESDRHAYRRLADVTVLYHAPSVVAPPLPPAGWLGGAPRDPIAPSLEALHAAHDLLDALTRSRDLPPPAITTALANACGVVRPQHSTHRAIAASAYRVLHPALYGYGCRAVDVPPHLRASARSMVAWHVALNLILPAAMHGRPRVANRPRPWHSLPRRDGRRTPTAHYP